MNPTSVSSTKAPPIGAQASPSQPPTASQTQSQPNPSDSKVQGGNTDPVAAKRITTTLTATVERVTNRAAPATPSQVDANNKGVNTRASDTSTGRTSAGRTSSASAPPVNVSRSSSPPAALTPRFNTATQITPTVLAETKAISQQLGQSGATVAIVVQKSQLLPRTSTFAQYPTPGLQPTSQQPAPASLVSESLPTLTLAKGVSSAETSMFDTTNSNQRDSKHGDSKYGGSNRSAVNASGLGEKQWLATVKLSEATGKPDKTLTVVTQQPIAVGAKLYITPTDSQGRTFNARAIHYTGQFQITKDSAATHTPRAMNPSQPWLAQVISVKPANTSDESVKPSLAGPVIMGSRTNATLPSTDNEQLVLKPLPSAPSKQPIDARQPWLVQLSVTDPKGQTRQHDVISVHRPPVGALIELTNAPQSTPTKSNALDRVLPIVHTGIRLAAAESRPMTDIIKMADAAIATSKSKLLFSQAEMQLLQSLREIGLKPQTDLKAVISQTGIFSPTAVPQKANNLESVGLAIPTKPGPMAHKEPITVALKSTQTQVTDQESGTDTSWKHQVSLLINLLSSSSNLSSAATPGTNPARDPLLALIGLFANQASTQGSSNKANTDAAPIKEKMVQVLKQALLGLQASSLKNLVEQHAQADTETATNTILNVELPIHWSNGLGKVSLILQQRQGRQDRDHDEDGNKVKSWQFELTMDFPGERILTTRCNLDEHRVRIQFWANKDDFKQLVERGMEGLKKRMEQDDIAVDYCGCALGLAPQEADKTRAQTLINTKV